MKDVSKALRTGIYSCINTINATINGINTPILVSDEATFEGGGDVYVTIGSVFCAGTDTQTSFKTRTSFDLHIVGKMWNGVTKDVVDDIANTIGELLIPSKQANGLGASADFQFLSLVRERDRHDQLIQGQKLIIRKIITYSLIVNQK